MIAAVVFESNTGFTEEFARLLGKELGISVYTIKEAEQFLPPKSPVVFLGWICAGNIAGYERAARSYRISAICGVGMRRPGEGAAKKIALDNRLDKIPFFYLQGGLERQKLGTFHRMLLGMMEKGLKHKSHLTEEEAQMLHMINTGGDCVCVEQLQPVIAYLNSDV